MNWRELVPVGRLGERIRKLLVAAVLFTCTGVAFQLVRNPVWDGAWDAYTWPQLFLGAPVLFLSGAVVWQLVGAIAASVHSKGRNTESLERPRDTQETLGFWLQESLRICLFYIVTCAVGDTPMVLNYLAEVLRWPWHLWWSNAVFSCLFLMIAVWWSLERLQAVKGRRSQLHLNA